MEITKDLLEQLVKKIYIDSDSDFKIDDNTKISFKLIDFPYLDREEEIWIYEITVKYAKENMIKKYKYTFDYLKINEGNLIELENH